jgi:outer membrane biosynthesis protein TonB
VISRSLRIGLRLGLLAGVVFALVKLVQSRRSSPAPNGGDGWKSSPLSSPLPQTAAPRRTEPARPEQGLVEPTMLQSLVDRKQRAADLEGTGDEAEADEDAEAAPAPAAAPPAAPPEPPVAAPPEPPAAAPPEPPAPAPPEPPVAPPVEKAASAKAPAAKAPSGKAPASAAGKAPAGKAGAARKARPPVAFVEPKGGVCPKSHPVKAKVSSFIYHLPGMLAYERTTPDRCYRGPEEAEADGFRRAKR